MGNVLWMNNVESSEKSLPDDAVILGVITLMCHVVIVC